jgi:hypothetical protein
MIPPMLVDLCRLGALQKYLNTQVPQTIRRQISELRHWPIRHHRLPYPACPPGLACACDESLIELLQYASGSAEAGLTISCHNSQ